MALSPIFLIGAMARLAAGVVRRDVALAHVNVGDRYSVARKGVFIFFARLLRVPVVLHQHAGEFIEGYARLPWLLKRLVKMMFSAAHCVVVIGEPWRRFVVDELGVEAERTIVIYNGVPRSPVRRFAEAKEELHFLFLGNLQEAKGVTTCSMPSRAIQLRPRDAA